MTGEFVKLKLKEEGIELVDVANAMGITPQNLQSKLKTSDIKVGVLEIIASAINKSIYFFFDNNNSKSNDPGVVYNLRTDSILENQMIPIYNIDAIAGILPILSDLQSTKPIDHLYIPNAPRCDGAIYASGDSMYPLLKSGDILAFKIIEDFINDVYWGEMYILYIETGDDIFRTVKYVKKGENKNCFKLVSQNKHHEDKEVLIRKIKAMAQVKITVRIN